MEASCMASLRQRLRQVVDLPDEWIRRASVSLAFASLIYGFVTLAFGVLQDDTFFVVCAVLGLILLICVLILPVCFGMVYPLWFDVAALLLLIGGALMKVQKEVSYFFYALGGVLMALLVVASLLLRCNMCVPRDSAPRVPNLAVAYHVQRAEGVAEVSPEGEVAPDLM